MQLGSRTLIGLTAVAVTTIATSASAQWVEFTEATSERLVLDDIYRVNDNIEKDFAWADFDRDGFVDLAVAGSFPAPSKAAPRTCCS